LESDGGLENLKVVNDRRIPAVVGGHILIRACPRLGMSGSAVSGRGLTPKTGTDVMKSRSVQ
jgi:hypothetical protein